jgi:hypothetical protein
LRDSSKTKSGKEDCEEVMNAVLPLAQKMLSKSGEFYPYGGYMKPDGEIAIVGAKDGETDHPKSQDLLNMLHESLSATAAKCKIKATAIIFDVRVNLPGSQEKSDAIQINLEHTDGYSAEVFLPYQKRPDGRVTYGDMFAQVGGHDIFGKSH